MQTDDITLTLYAVDAVQQQLEFVSTLNSLDPVLTEQWHYAIVATDGHTADTAYVDVVPFTDLNLALGKPVDVSSSNGNNRAEYLTDGLSDTRWESLWGDAYTDEWKDSQQLTIDLQAHYMIDRVCILWEAAYATLFTLQSSNDGITWTDLNNYSPTAAARQCYTDFGSIEARYVRIKLHQRALQAYGYSIYEVEVYGTGKTRDVGQSLTPVSNQSDATDMPVYDLTHLQRPPQGLYIIGNTKRTTHP